LHTAQAAEFSRAKLPLPSLVFKFLLEESVMLGKQTIFTPNITRNKATVLKYLKDNKETRIPQTDIGNCMAMLNESTSKNKISSPIEPVCETLCKDPTSQIGRYGNFLPSTKLSSPLSRNVD
jgi:hypothetical protein